MKFVILTTKEKTKQKQKHKQKQKTKKGKNKKKQQKTKKNLIKTSFWTRECYKMYEDIFKVQSYFVNAFNLFLIV